MPLFTLILPIFLKMQFLNSITSINKKHVLVHVIVIMFVLYICVCVCICVSLLLYYVYEIVYNSIVLAYFT